MNTVHHGKALAPKIANNEKKKNTATHEERIATEVMAIIFSSRNTFFRKSIIHRCTEEVEGVEVLDAMAELLDLLQEEFLGVVLTRAIAFHVLDVAFRYRDRFIAQRATQISDSVVTVLQSSFLHYLHIQAQDASGVWAADRQERRYLTAFWYDHTYNGVVTEVNVLAFFILATDHSSFASKAKERLELEREFLLTECIVHKYPLLA